MPTDATSSYDDNNIFARILRGELPNQTVFEDEWTLAFHDTSPQAPIHILVIPKGAYVSWDDFTSKASDIEITAFVRAIGNISRDLGLVEPGYRLLTNIGIDANQMVPHLHVHIFGGKNMGPLLSL
jgi:histidine triad (HIT) family protein